MSRHRTSSRSKQRSEHDAQHSLDDEGHQQRVNRLERKVDVMIGRVRRERVDRLHLRLHLAAHRRQFLLRALDVLYQPPYIVSVSLIFLFFKIDICPSGTLHFVPYVPFCFFPFQLYPDDNIIWSTLKLASH